MLYAADWTKKHLGNKAKALWEPDTFGHPGNMPQLAKLGEFNCYFHNRCNPGWHDFWPLRVWEGIDGTSITALTISYNGNLEPESVMRDVMRHCRFGFRNALHIWGIGDHGGALSRLQKKRLEAYRHKPVMPTFIFSTTSKLLSSIKRDREKLPHNKGETFYVFDGCFTTHALMKSHNRQCESALLSAETIAALAGIDCVDTLRTAWIPALFNQFHDILGGAAVHDTYIDAERRVKKSLRIAAKITKEAISQMAHPVKDGKELVIFNPLGFNRTEPVRA